VCSTAINNPNRASSGARRLLADSDSSFATFSNSDLSAKSTTSSNRPSNALRAAARQPVIAAATMLSLAAFYLL
jgi:hypothetical protein